MSISQLLTITESHGFHALMSVAALFLGRLAQLGHGLRNLSCGNRQFARMDVGGGSWLGTLKSDVANARRKPVLWFDTFGGRGDSIDGNPCLRHALLPGSLVHSPVPAFAEQARGAESGQRRR